MSVVIPVRDGVGVIERCLDALAAQHLPPPFEVIVIDNASRDETLRVAQAHPLQPVVVSEPRRGSYAARNAGIAQAKAPALAFTDADCVPDPGWLRAGTAALAAAPLVGGCIAPYGDAGTAAARYDRALYLQQDDYVTRLGFAATANLFVRREVLDRIGGFDDDLRSGGDLELCRRALSAGFALGYEPAAVVRHPPRGSARELWRLHRRLGAGWAALARRGLHPPWWRDPALRWPTLGMVVTAVNDDGPPVRRRRLAPVHAVAMTARWTGRLLGR